jgi:hypothetical protein
MHLKRERPYVYEGEHIPETRVQIPNSIRTSGTHYLFDRSPLWLQLCLIVSLCETPPLATFFPSSPKQMKVGS